MRQHDVILLGALFAACGGGESDPATPTLDPATFGLSDSGAFECGHRVLETTYTPAEGLAARTIPVHVWYPTHDADGEHTRYRGIFQDPLAWEEATLADPAWPAGYPVLAHSHGHMGFAGNSHRMMCHFAAHGWVAIAPEHLGNTLTDTPDPRPLSVYYHRPLDVTAALELVATLPTGDPLAGQIDLSRVAVSGHSFGTYTAWALAGATFDRPSIESRCDGGEVASCTEQELSLFDAPLAEPRAKAAIPMAGGRHPFFGETGLASVALPMLLMTGSLDDVGADVVVSSADGVALTWVDVEGGCHQLYGLGNTSVGDAACEALSDEEGFSIVNPYALAYARYHVLGERGDEVRGIIEDGAGLSPRVTVTRE